MKIGVAGPENEFVAGLRKALRAALPGDELVDWLPKQPAPAKDLEALIAIGPVTAEMLEGQSQLKLIQTASDGYDAVEVDAATKQGIWVSYTPGAASGNADSVAEYAVMALIAANRKLGEALAFLHDHDAKRPMLTTALVGKTVCIYGYGDIGERVAARLKPFGAKISAVNRHADEVKDEGVQAFSTEQRAEALGSADAVVLCVRGSKENAHLVNAAFLAEMKRGATLVNVARGTLVDEAALLGAIESGHLGAAALDVQEHEPVAVGSPLLQHPQIFVTPHVAGFTQLTLDGSVRYVTGVMQGLREGRLPTSLVNKPEQPRIGGER